MAIFKGGCFGLKFLSPFKCVVDSMFLLFKKIVKKIFHFMGTNVFANVMSDVQIHVIARSFLICFPSLHPPPVPSTYR
jgi:hypothetical protein